jgi:hypothetical protein
MTEQPAEKNMGVLLLDALVILIALALFLRSFFLPGFITSHEYGRYFERLFEYNLAIRDGHFPVRWFPDFVLRYGYPFPNFYAPLFFYLAEMWLLLGSSYLFAVKATVVLSTLVGAGGMYALGHVLWGRRAGLLAALAFTFVPYRIADLYVRGDLSEFLAMSLLPLLFWQRVRFYETQKATNLVCSSGFHAAIICSHNITALLATGLLMIFDTIFFVRSFKHRFVRIAIAYVLAFSLSAFFWIPALFEKRYVAIERVAAPGSFFDFRKNFLNARELFIPRWGYGPSQGGVGTPMSLQLGIAPLAFWLLGAIMFALVPGLDRRKKRQFLGMSALALIFILMTTRFSKPLWEVIPLLRFAQFPWRFHVLTAPLLALLAPAAVYAAARLRPRLGLLITVAGVLLFTVLGIGYCRRGGTVPIDEAKFSREAFSTELITSALQNEYLPRWVALIPKSSRYARRLVSVENEKTILPSQERTQRVVFSVSMQAGGRFFFGQFYFPGWVCLIDGVPLRGWELTRSGMMRIFVPPGDHRIEFRFTHTPIRLVSDVLSLTALVGFIAAPPLFLIRRRAQKKNR